MASSLVHILTPGLLAVFVLSGCRVGGSSTPERENERLRAQVRSLQGEVRTLASERDELLAKLSDKFTSPNAIAAAKALPLAVSIELDSLSGLTPPGSDSPATGVTVYVVPRDGFGRFVQVVGSLRLEVFRRAADGSTRPIGSATLGPDDLRQRYRSGFTGTHYTLDLPLSESVPRPIPPGSGIQIKATLSDLATSNELSASLDCP